MGKDRKDVSEQLQNWTGDEKYANWMRNKYNLDGKGEAKPQKSGGTGGFNTNELSTTRPVRITPRKPRSPCGNYNANLTVKDD